MESTSVIWYIVGLLASIIAAYYALNAGANLWGLLFIITAFVLALFIARAARSLN
ncbi:hypothetical protein B0H94_104144 [Salsuginibacillus halophilus]|uniref:Uncharacterized protein n=1 Tax=Salsuginibacillus halophilus TaxID=517424 RepID=A0A2P8HQP5_9BACI|nr:hypothetical protein [Salsuginibacillus halophilus]PSL48543.1 hypothetical protein B0H94_104144 [Salsuginibacillus halophilus]